MADHSSIHALDKEKEVSPESAVSLEPAGNHGQNAFPDGGARAWGVAAGCAGALFCTFGFANSFGVFQEYYVTHQLSDKSPSTIAWIGSVQIFFLLAATLFGGPLFDRYGAVVLWPTSITYLFAIMMTSLAKEFYQFMLAQGILAGIAMGMTMAPGMAAVGQYFQKKRGAALGLAVGGSSLGGVIFPIALSKMLANPSLGFGWTVRICGFIMLAVLLPSVLVIRARLPPRKDQLFLPRAFQEPQYVALIASIFLMMLGVFIPIFYLPTYAVLHGMSTQLSFYLSAILNGASFFGRLSGGILADKVGRLNMLCAMGIITGILCLCWQATKSNASIIVFAVLYGFFSGTIVSLMSACFAQVPKDPRNIGTYMGMGMFVVAFAALAGPPMNGALISTYGGFDQASTLSGVLILVGACFVLMVKHTTDKGVFGKV